MSLPCVAVSHGYDTCLCYLECHLRTFILPPNLICYCCGWANPGDMPGPYHKNNVSVYNVSLFTMMRLPRILKQFQQKICTLWHRIKKLSCRVKIFSWNCFKILGTFIIMVALLCYSNKCIYFWSFYALVHEPDYFGTRWEQLTLKYCFTEISERVTCLNTFPDWNVYFHWVASTPPQTDEPSPLPGKKW